MAKLFKLTISSIAILAAITCQRPTRRIPIASNGLGDSLQTVANSFFRAAMAHDSSATRIRACDSIAVVGAMYLSKDDSIVFASLSAATAGAPQALGDDTVGLGFVVPQTAKDSVVATVTFVRNDGHWRVGRFMVPDHI